MRSQTLESGSQRMISTFAVVVALTLHRAGTDSESHKVLIRDVASGRRHAGQLPGRLWPGGGAAEGRETSSRLISPCRLWPASCSAWASRFPRRACRRRCRSRTLPRCSSPPACRRFRVLACRSMSRFLQRGRRAQSRRRAAAADAALRGRWAGLRFSPRPAGAWRVCGRLGREFQAGEPSHRGPHTRRAAQSNATVRSIWHGLTACPCC